MLVMQYTAHVPEDCRQYVQGMFMHIGKIVEEDYDKWKKEYKNKNETSNFTSFITSQSSLRKELDNENALLRNGSWFLRDNGARIEIFLKILNSSYILGAINIPPEDAYRRLLKNKES